MKKIIWIFVCLVTLISCDVTTHETKDSIEFVVKDFSDHGVHKKITYTSGWNGTPMVVHSNDTVWSATFKEFSDQLDADLSADIEADTAVKFGIYIYENGTLVKSRESDQVQTLSIKYTR